MEANKYQYSINMNKLNRKHMFGFYLVADGKFEVGSTISKMTDVVWRPY